MSISSVPFCFLPFSVHWHREVTSYLRRFQDAAVIISNYPERGP
jgi:hypothetical protein